MKKKGKIARRTLLVVFIVVLVITTAINTFVSIQLKNALIKNYSNFGLSYVKTAAEYIDGNTVKEYYEKGKKDVYYLQVEKYLKAAANSTVDSTTKVQKGASIKYFYVFVPDEEEFTYIWDAEPGSAPEDFLEKYPYSEGAEEQAIKMVNKEVTEDVQFYIDAESHIPILTVSVPLCDSKGDVVAIVAADLSVEGINNAVYGVIANLVISIIVIMGLTMIIYYHSTKKLIINPILKLHDATEEIIENIEKDKTIKIDIHTNDEIEMLAKSFENMDIKLKDYIKQNAQITAEKEKIGAELELAKRIQADMLPNVFPPFPERDDFDIYASMTPAKEVGGDFYDIFLIDDTHLAMVIADVSGKGIPAALFMMMSKILIQNTAMNGESPSKILETVNNIICSNNREEMFVTVWLGIVDLESGLMTASNAGHEKPIIKNPDGDFELFKDKHGFVIGGMDGVKYRDYEIKLQKGSKLFIYTDGAVEATNKSDELFGAQRLLDSLNPVKNKSSRKIISTVKTDVDDFVGDAPQFDDLTMLCFEYIGETNEITIDATLEDVETAIDFVARRADKLPFDAKEKNKIKIAMDEIISNVARYAYEDKEGRVTIKVDTNDSLKITVIDNGIPYNPLEKEDPDITLPAEDRGIGGYGIYLVKKIMDEIEYEYKDNQNILTMKKKYK
jgi:sigma-B regulation protein RsbU (phosphoserine phosphatase)